MAIVWQDGFDLYNNASDLAMIYYSGYATSISTTAGRFGGGAWSTTGYGLVKTIPTCAEVWSSFAFNTASTAAGDKIIGMASSSAGEEMSITYNPSTGVWKVWRGNAVTVLGTATAFVPINAWHWLDIRFKLSATLGEIEVWLDEVQIISLTAQNTVQNTGQTQLVSVQIGDNSAGHAPTMSADDWFIYTPGTRLGDSRIETLVPTSDAGTNNGTPSTGTNHYAVVDEAQFNTTDYITMPNTSGDKETFGHGALVNTPTTIYSVAVKMVSQKSDAGAFYIEPLVVSSGTEGDGASASLTTSWGVQSAIFETDPHTSGAWAYSAVNASSIGYKVP